MPRSIVVFVAHPRIERSISNVRMRRVAEGITGVTVVDLYAEYPNFEIDIRREQARIEDHDAVIMQHPVYWFSSPSIVKEWVDQVFSFGWAFGPEGDALKGKLYLHSVTTAASHGVFARDVTSRSALRAQFHPFEATATLCGMRYLPPFSLFGAPADEPREERIERHAHAFALLLRGLRDDTLDLAQPYRAIQSEVAV